jgi:hypothetical protein
MDIGYVRFQHHDSGRIALCLAVDLVPEGSWLLRFHGVCSDLEELDDLLNRLVFCGVEMLTWLGTLSALPGLGLRIAMTSKGEDIFVVVKIG